MVILLVRLVCYLGADLLDVLSAHVFPHLTILLVAGTFQSDQRLTFVFS